MTQRVSVILPTRDRPEMVGRALASILAGDVVPDEVVVVDQSAVPLTMSDLGGRDRPATCDVRIERSAPGLSRAVNHGCRVASHDLLAFTHDDCTVDRGWLDALVRSLAAAAADGPVAVTGRVVASAPESAGAFAPALRDDPEPASFSGRVDHGVLRPMNLLLDRDTYWSVGGLDDRLGPGTPFPGGEDHDLCLRLLEAGVRIEYEPTAIVRHRAWRTPREYLPLRWAYGVAHGAFYAKNLRWQDPFVLTMVRRDVGRRVRSFPRRVRREGRRAFGDPLFLAGNVVGALRWTARFSAVDRRTAALARAAIAPVPVGVHRPVWSVMIPTYHCARYLGATLHSVVDQGLPPEEMEIQVVDDHSVEDDPASVVREVGDGRVAFVRHPENRGNVATFDTCLALSRGRYVHILHGDDLVQPGFYAILGRALDDHPECVAAVCRHVVVDDAGDEIVTPEPLADRAGVLHDLFSRLVQGQLLQPPAVVVRREVYERIGGFDHRIHRYGEDWEMWTRVAAEGPVWYTPVPLASYRVRAGSISDSSVRTGENMRDLRRAAAVTVETATGRLDVATVARLQAAGRRANALGAIRRGLRAGDAGDHESAWRQVTAAVATSRRPDVLAAAVAVPVRLTLRSARRRLLERGAR